MQTDKIGIVKAAAFAVIVIAVIGAIISAIYFDKEARKEKPVVLTQEQMHNPAEVPAGRRQPSLTMCSRQRSKKPQKPSRNRLKPSRQKRRQKC